MKYTVIQTCLRRQNGFLAVIWTYLGSEQCEYGKVSHSATLGLPLQKLNQLLVWVFDCGTSKSCWLHLIKLSVNVKLHQNATCCICERTCQSVPSQTQKRALLSSGCWTPLPVLLGGGFPATKDRQQSWWSDEVNKLMTDDDGLKKKKGLTATVLGCLCV